MTVISFPPVTWSQTFYTVNMKVFIDFKGLASILIYPDKVILDWETNQQDSEKKSIKINLFNKIDPVESDSVKCPEGIKLTLKKFPANSGYWERVTIEEEDFPWITLDMKEQIGPWTIEPSQ